MWVVAALAGQLAALGPREMLAVCHAPGQAWAVHVMAVHGAKASDGVTWQLGLAAVGADGATYSVADNAKAPPALLGVPASPTVSWLEADDGSVRIWSPHVSIWMAPQPAIRGVGAVEMRWDGGVCPGAGLLQRHDADAAPVRLGLLMQEGGNRGVVVGREGGLSPVEAAKETPPAAGARRRADRRPARAAPPAPAGWLTDGRIEFQTLDVARTDGGLLPQAWRLVLSPSRTLGRLTALGTQHGGLNTVVQLVSGSVQGEQSGGNVVGVLRTLGPPKAP